MRTTVGFGLMGTFLFTLLAACSGDDDASAEASAAVRSQIVTECKARYVCKDVGDSPLEIAISPRDAGMEGNERMMFASDGCHAGYIILTADGRGVRNEYASGEVATQHDIAWRIDGERFDVCEGETCVKCTLLDVPVTQGASSAGGGKCKGSASSCYGRAGGSCSSQKGCYGGSHVRWNGDLEFECKGSSTSCDAIGTAESCEAQDGCRWE